MGAQHAEHEARNRAVPQSSTGVTPALTVRPNPLPFVTPVAGLTLRPDGSFVGRPELPAPETTDPRAEGAGAGTSMTAASPPSLLDALRRRSSRPPVFGVDRPERAAWSGRLPGRVRSEPTLAPAGRGPIRRIARDALVSGQPYHLVVDDVHRSATFLGAEQVGEVTQYWFDQGNGTRFYLRSTDAYPVMTEEEWKKFVASVQWQEHRARAAGVTTDERSVVEEKAKSGKDRYYLLAAFAEWRPCAGNVALPITITTRIPIGPGLHKIVAAGAGLVKDKKASAEQVSTIVTRYLTGPEDRTSSHSSCRTSTGSPWWSRPCSSATRPSGCPY